MALNLDQLRAFLAIYEQGSIGRAAVTLGYPQPALSRMLRGLEERVGARLFERRTSGVVPTLAADTLRPFAQEIVVNSAAALDEIAALQGGAGGLVRIGVVASIASRVLPAAIDAHLKRWPGTKFQVMTGIDDQIQAALAACSVDVAVVGRKLDDSDVPLSHVRLGSDAIRVVVGPHHRFRGGEPPGLDMLAREAWLLAPREASIMKSFDAAFLSRGLAPPAAVVETWSLATARALVASCDLVGWLPVDVDDRDDIIPLDVSALAVTSEYFLCKRAHGLLPIAARRFIQFLVDTCAVKPARVLRK